MSFIIGRWFLFNLYQIFVKCKIFKEKPSPSNSPNASLLRPKISLLGVTKVSTLIKAKETLQTRQRKDADNNLFIQWTKQNLLRNIIWNQIRMVKMALTLISSIISKYQQISNTSEEAHTCIQKIRFKNHHCFLY